MSLSLGASDQSCASIFIFPSQNQSYHGVVASRNSISVRSVANTC